MYKEVLIAEAKNRGFVAGAIFTPIGFKDWQCIVASDMRYKLHAKKILLISSTNIGCLGWVPFMIPIYKDGVWAKLIPDSKKDPINHPSHYTDGQIEVIDFIEDKKLGFNLGNCVKYIARAGKKDPDKHIEDLKKAAWYLDREINNISK